MKTYNERLQYLIGCKKIDQAMFAKLTGFHKSQISKWLSGSTETPQRKTLLKISEFFGCNIDWLADGSGVPFPTNDNTANGDLTRINSGMYPRPPKQNEYGVTKAELCGGQEDDAKKEKPSLNGLNDDYHKKLSKILQNPKYRSAIIHNLEAFGNAAESDEEMNRMEEKMERMEKMLQVLLERTELKDTTESHQKREANSNK